jgi:hypothetical protein
VCSVFRWSRDYHDQPGGLPERSQAVAADVGGLKNRRTIGSRTEPRISATASRPATQITPTNVQKLELAWTFHTGDFKGSDDPGEIANEVTPLQGQRQGLHLHAAQPGDRTWIPTPDASSGDSIRRSTGRRRIISI